MSFLQLVIICAVVLLVLKLIKASAKLIVGALVVAGVVWALLNFLPGII